jgi:acetyl-CoA synthetase
VAGAVVPDTAEAAARPAFWATARAELDGLPEGRGLNIAHEAVDRHAAGPRGSHPAVRWLHRDGRVTERSYAELASETSRFANVLSGLGIRRGDRVFTLLGRVPAVVVTALGTFKAGGAFCPLFQAFGPDPVYQRLSLGSGRVLVTTADRYRKKVEPIRDSLPDLEHVLLVGGAEDLPDCALDWDTELAAAADAFVIPPTPPSDMALLHFTSGTTGAPKGAVHVHEAVVAHHATAATALDLRAEDVFWCTADPGWVTGTSYGIIAPLTHGVTSIVDEAEFDAERWYGTLQDQRVTVWYTAPTALRRLMRAGPELPRRFDLSALRFIASVGEPLNAEVVRWSEAVLGLPVHDNWWQTETGGIMIANAAGADVRPGSMGRPLQGVEATILRQGADGRAAVDDAGAVQVEDDGEVGELALRPGWPSMFRGYLGDEERYEAAFAGGWYLSGDLARRDADGWFWFVGRADDVIKSSGHLIGPFEVESTLLEHPAVVEAGVIGVPDPVAGEVVKAFVSLAPGYEPSDELRLELIGFARARLGAAVAPRRLDFDQDLPRTTSGKIVRRLLKARELGLPEGDLSTLEGKP